MFPRLLVILVNLFSFTCYILSNLIVFLLGLFIVNIVLRDQSLRPAIIKNFKNQFSNIISYKLQEDLNEIFICSHTDINTGHLREGCIELNKFFKKHNTIDNGIDTEKFMDSIVVHSS